MLGSHDVQEGAVGHGGHVVAGEWGVWNNTVDSMKDKVT